MLKKIYYLLILFIAFPQAMLLAQTDGRAQTFDPFNPVRATIADIAVHGLDGTFQDGQELMMINFSELQVGQQVMVPGEEISRALRRFMQLGLFDDANIGYSKFENDSIWLVINLVSRPLIQSIEFFGTRRNDQDDILRRTRLGPGMQITQTLMDRTERIIREHYADQGFNDAAVALIQRPLEDDPNLVVLEIHVDRQNRMRVNSITVEGNHSVSDNQIRLAMRQTNVRSIRLPRTIFRTRRFVEDNFAEDRERVIELFNSHGFRNAEIISYTIERYDDRSVNIHMVVYEGPVFHIRSISWVGNTEFPTAQLERILDMRPGDIYNQPRLLDRLLWDQDAVWNLYQNQGFMFSHIDPIERGFDNDSVDLEIRIIEGPQATIRRVIIQGNDRLYENVVRRELHVVPGDVFRRDNLIRSMMEIGQTGHFDAEALQRDIGPGISPNIEDGTVDITFPLVSRGNDQIELSAGWGVTGVIGRLGLTLNNFSVNNLLNPDMRRRGFIPQGDGQTLILSAQTNGRFYQSYQFSLIEPWLGGRRPNHFSVSAFYSRFTGLNSDFYTQNLMFHPGMMGMMGGMGGMGMGGGMWHDMTQYALDPNQVFNILGVTVAYGRRLNWPDDFFQFMTELSWQRYGLQNWTWNQFPFHTGVSNSIALGLTLSRRSTDSPLYTRFGSEFSLSVNATPPFSLLSGRDYSTMAMNDPAKFRWNEYHLWRFRARTFTPLTNPFGTFRRTPVIATRVEFGFLGHYNRYKLSPFGTFDMGGDGMSGAFASFATTMVGLRGYDNNSVAMQARAFSRLGLELRFPFILEQNATIFGLAFVEAGNAWMQVRDFNPFDLKRSAGAGIRIILPMVGLIGVDWAYGFDTVMGRPHPNMRRDRGGSQFHFVIGQEF